MSTSPAAVVVPHTGKIIKKRRTFSTKWNIKLLYLR